MSKDSKTNSFRALIVSEQTHECDIYVEQFRTWNGDICATNSLTEAGKVIGELARLDLSVDVILLDQEHIHPAQLQFVQQTREHFSREQVPIIVIGSTKFIDYCSEQFPTEISQMLTKPCAPSKLEEAVEQVLETRISPVPANTDAPSADNSGQSIDYGIDVLVAEDNDVNQIVFTEILNDMGIHYKIANDGQEAIKLWKEHRPALILMDVSMPLMNGHEATRKIRQIEQADNLAPTPICAITAHALKGDKEDCFAAGMDDYLSKPISPDMMCDKIQQMLPESHPLSRTIDKNQAA